MAAEPTEAGSQQLPLSDRWLVAARRAAVAEQRRQAVLCAGCREHEARYGFRPNHDDDPAVERPRTLCFACFRVELDRRQAVAARLARGWNGHQVTLPLEQTLETLTRRRRRAQIAARHALGAT
jgi:hypothetical protein